MVKNKRPTGRRLRLPTFFEGLKDALIEKIVGALVVIIFLVLAFLLFEAFLRGSDYFKLRAVESIGFPDKASAVAVNNEFLRACKSRNIFNIDISSIARSLGVRYPEARSAVVRRTLPDKLTVIMDFRIPVAMAGETKFYPVDADGYALFTVQPKDNAALPVISGVEVKYDGQAVRKIDSVNLRYALDLLREIKRARFLASHRLISIDAASARDMAFYLDDGLEVRIGFEYFGERLRKLKNTLSDTRLVRDKIKYIDLRFDGVTIGPK